MKVLNVLFGIVLLSCLFACVEEVQVSPETNDEVTEVKVIGPEAIQFEAVAGGVITKGSSIQDGSALTFNWAVGDTLGIFPNQGNQVEFPISSAEGGTSASFDGGGWALRNNAEYAAYYPFSVWNYHRDHEAILLDYSGQVQNGNGSFAHLSTYDYLASDKTTPVNSSVTFMMKRQGSVLYIDIVVPEPETLTALTISCDEAIFVEKAELDISGDEPVVTPIEMSKTLTLEFENTVTTEANETVRAYMAVQPMDLTDKTVTATLSTAVGSYSASVTQRVVNRTKAAFLRFSDDFTPVNIEFADAEVKRICVENWDTNGDGELSYKEAAAVTDLGDAFRASYESPNTIISSFEELQYFTGLNTIGDYAFYYCTNLQNVNLPATIQRIGFHAFDRCPLSQIVLPDSLTDIDMEAFSNLTMLHIPKNVHTILRTSGLYRCPLTEITVDENNLYFSAVDGVLFDRLKTKLICYPPEKTGTTYAIPNGVVTIGDCSFYLPRWLIDVSFPESIQSIEGSAFRYAKLNGDLVLPEGLLEIGSDAFEFCDALTSITIPSSVTKTSGAICNGNQLQNIFVDEDNSYFKSIDGVLFTKDGSSLINYPTGRDGAYSIPTGVTTIDYSAFGYAYQLNDITIPEGVTTISGYAFLECKSLTSLLLPSSLTYVGPKWISKTESVTFLSTTPLPSNHISIPANCKIFVPNESIELYKNEWSKYADRIFGIDVGGSVVGPEPEIPN